ncbi:uncharacterized protein LOC114165377 [Vigna unguiculata]|uniref:uncharacterized protein LOC114165377 n=1 Tax=Vigna unguiculata TaxID=3917 RepID=UPI001015DB53|nr:uncharacterized protein LOC114165377 [Vigna unguiculata]
MEASHILLGRSWQYDIKAIHDGFTNKISFMYQDKRVVLKPLSPKELCEDRIKMREKLTNERKSKTLDNKKNSETLERKMRENETLEGKQLYLAREMEVSRVLCTRQPLYLSFFQSQILNANQIGKFELPSSIESFLQDYKDVFPANVPDGLPPLRGIEHHIDLILVAFLPNGPTYRSNP